MTENANSPTPTRLLIRELLELEVRVTELRRSIGASAWDGEQPSGRSPARGIQVGDRVTRPTMQGKGLVVGYHEGALVVVWPPQMEYDVRLSPEAHL